MGTIASEAQRLKAPHTSETDTAKVYGADCGRVRSVRKGALLVMTCQRPTTASRHTEPVRVCRGGAAWIGSSQIRAARRIGRVPCRVPIPTPLFHIPSHV